MSAAPQLRSPSSPWSDLELVTQDGTSIAARLYEACPRARGAAFIVGAMGVPQSYYAPFAGWLASLGLHALTFDFRGMGRSRRGSLRGLEADIVTWAEQDTTAALQALAARAPGLPITWIGHSLGGQIVPFVRSRPRVERIITVAAGSGYWRQNTPALRRKVWLMWWAAVPVATALCGYFPGKQLRMVGDLPRGVIRQWRSWCLDPDYAVGVEGETVRLLYAGVTTPIIALAFTDDEMMSAENIESLHAFYAGAPRSMHRIAPGDVGLRAIGHFGFFRETMQAPLWERHVLGQLALAGSTTSVAAEQLPVTALPPRP